ncbi:MAG: tRNA threonylcarbamoyladenosine dehydratase [Acholeplasmatales bacterium]|nr:tRNA threonylcarbamoyladenosine dehydratase [Acholeplasmatales bacterium]
MLNQFSRTALLLKNESMEILKNKKVIIFGIGGVGGYVCEALARSGIYNFTLVDNDDVALTNINRQIIATFDTVGMPKVDVMEKRILSINPDAKIEKRQCFYLPENANEFDFNNYDYIVDCVDTVTAKISIIVEAKKCNKPIISAMGAGNKMDPLKLEVADIYKTSVCPLARVMRYELKKRRIKSLKVVYSKEEPIKIDSSMIEEDTHKKIVPGSNAFVPTTMGLVIASEIIKDLINYKK